MNKSYLYSLTNLDTKEVIDQIEINKKDYDLALMLLSENNVLPTRYKISFEEIDYTRENCIIENDLNFDYEELEDDEFFNDDII